MRNWTIFENQTTFIPGFDPSLLPPGSDQYVTVHIRGAQDQIYLEAGSYIGVIPLLNESLLYITPRVGYAAIARMLSVSERLDESVRREFDHFSALGSGSGDGEWIQLLARTYTNQLEVIERNSLRFDRPIITTRENDLHGKISPVRTTVNLLQRKDLPIVMISRNRSYDTPENRFLGAAAYTLLNLKIASREKNQILIRWSNFLKAGLLTGHEIEMVIKNLNRGKYLGSRSYYIPALVMARLILLQGGIALDKQEFKAEALLTNMNSLFESYLRIFLRQNLATDGFLIEKLESGAPTLFTDGTAELKPDIIVSDKTGVRLLIDAKYKLNEIPDSGDFYQMKAYLDGYAVNQGLIVRPTLETLNEGLRSHRLHSDQTIYEYRINPLKKDYGEAALLEQVRGLIR